MGNRRSASFQHEEGDAIYKRTYTLPHSRCVKILEYLRASLPKNTASFFPIHNFDLRMAMTKVKYVAKEKASVHGSTSVETLAQQINASDNGTFKLRSPRVEEINYHHVLLENSRTPEPRVI